jgi:hypothetical protein
MDRGRERRGREEEEKVSGKESANAELMTKKGRGQG